MFKKNNARKKISLAYQTRRKKHIFQNNIKKTPYQQPKRKYQDNMV